MAAYPTPAGHRIGYDRDGSSMFYIDQLSVVNVLSTAQAQALNDETDTTAFGLPYNSATYYIGLVFPELRDITGAFDYSTVSGTGSNIVLQYSANTTNGQDGTWTNSVGLPHDGPATIPGYRSSIVAVSLAAVKAVRMQINVGQQLGGAPQFWTFHVYGQPSAGQNPDSLRLWQPVTAAEVTTVFDFGDIARATSATQSFRVHNQSAAKTASTITCSAEALTDASPSLIGQFQFSLDNIAFANSITIPNLGPGATSAVLYVRDSVAAGAATSVWAARMVVAAGAFV